MISLFSTKIVYIDNCNLNLENLERKCRNHMATEPSSTRSNIGGYQGHYFDDNELYTLIERSIPSIQDKPIKKFKYGAWVNVNGFGSFNERHSHDPHGGTFLSGVFYLESDAETGIIFSDPRPAADVLVPRKKTKTNENSNLLSYISKQNRLIIFPSWLVHWVPINKSKRDRISISFNIQIKGQVGEHHEFQSAKY